MANTPYVPPPRTPTTNRPYVPPPVTRTFNTRAPARATTILELESGIAWRSRYRRAKFGDAEFYVDTTVRDSARRIVRHEFPKRDAPYAEDMGRRAREITIRGYCIVFPNETKFPNDKLKKKDYTGPRDVLIAALETEGAQILQTPLLGFLKAVCSRYRVTEEDKLGGYCTFDMTFQEYGQAPSTGTRDSAAGVYYAAEDNRKAIVDNINSQIKKAGSPAASGVVI
jgi:prophage DNA circulation protein